MAVRYVPRTFGGTLIIGGTPIIPVFVPSTFVLQMQSFDGSVQAQSFDGSLLVRSFDGAIQGVSFDGNLQVQSFDNAIQIGGN